MPERTRERPPAAEAQPAPARQDEPPQAATGEAGADKRQRHRAAGSSEPRLERIVVGKANDEPGSGEAPAESARPARKGWWQRRLSGE
jgi:hypothetical protein